MNLGGKYERERNATRSMLVVVADSPRSRVMFELVESAHRNSNAGESVTASVRYRGKKGKRRF